jgi:hypothetical protein
MNNSAKMLPARIKYMSWTLDFNPSADIIEDGIRHWYLRTFKYYNDDDEFDPLNNQWVACYILYGYEGAEDMLPKSITLQEVKDTEDENEQFDKIYNWISCNVKTHGCVAPTIEEALDNLLKWVYDEGLL